MAAFDEIERFISAELSGRNHPGSSVSLVKGDEVVWAKGFGYANIREGTPATPETTYGCASVTKPVVTIGFLQLMEKGKFNLDDKVNSHLDVKIRDVKGEEPLIRDLLTHYTGMPTRVPPLYLIGEKPANMREYIDSTARQVRPRGEAWAYCNTAFTIVGYLIKQYSGIDYDAYLKELNLPHIRRIGGLRAIAAVACNGPIWFHNVGAHFEQAPAGEGTGGTGTGGTQARASSLGNWLKEAGRVNGVEVRITREKASEEAIAAWLLGK